MLLSSNYRFTASWDMPTCAQINDRPCIVLWNSDSTWSRRNDVRVETSLLNGWWPVILRFSMDTDEIVDPAVW